MAPPTAVPVRLQDFGVTRERGFLPAADPLPRLTQPLFEKWEDFAAAIPSIISASASRRVILRLPALDLQAVEAALHTDAERERWMQVVSFAGTAWVWGEDPMPAQALPEHLAALWVHIGRLLVRPPILAYVSYNLVNWRRIDPEGPIELGNICRLCNFQGVQDEEWFGNVHVAIEAAAGPGLGAVEDMQEATARGDAAGASAALQVLAASLTTMRKIFARMREKAEPFIFQERMRIYMQGWTHEDLPNGMSYPGVLAEPQRFYGETGAQSSVLPAFDAALDIPTVAASSGTDTANHEGMVSYLQELRTYMPPSHSALIDAIGAGPCVRDFAARVGGDLLTSYNLAVKELYRFRSLHLHMVMDFVRRWDKRTDAEVMGTGGTAFMPYLKAHREATQSRAFEAQGVSATSKL